MKKGFLSDYFSGVGAKRLTAVELGKQHEFQGVDDFREILGTPGEKIKLKTSFVWLSDEDTPEILESTVTWSDVRRDRPNRSSEYHMYYPKISEPIVWKASPGDLLVLARKSDESLCLMFAPMGSTSEHQLLWLFGITEDDLFSTIVRKLDPSSSQRMGVAATILMDAVGIETAETDDGYLEEMKRRFPGGFPTTAKFSAYARGTLPDVSPLDDPDGALLAWFKQEELLFRTFERHLVGERLAGGFMSGNVPDVDSFVSFSLSVQNRRKSRAGFALGNHVEAMLSAWKIRFKREARTETKSRPDFLFPGEEEYHDPEFQESSLFMLGVKTSCKDRWRQVLTEADRIGTKHLLTLEPGISAAQIAEIKTRNLRLVVPKELHTTYHPDHRDWLMGHSDFIELVSK
jgi:hypothetical protein